VKFDGAPGVNAEVLLVFWSVTVPEAEEAVIHGSVDAVGVLVPAEFVNTARTDTRSATKSSRSQGGRSAPKTLLK